MTSRPEGVELRECKKSFVIMDLMPLTREQQVSVCGCGSKRFPAGSTFFLNGKSLTVKSSFRSACSSACGEVYCATVNLAKKVGSGFSWKSKDVITFPTPEPPAPPAARCTANNKYNSQQVSVCGCGG